MTRAAQQLTAVGLVLGALLVVYWQVIAGLISAWSTDDNYSHGFFIVPLALYFAWERRGAIAAAQVRPSLVGALVVAGSLFLLVAGLLGAELFLSRVSIIGALAGAILFLFGWPMLRIVLFPLAFMLLMVPLPAIIFNKIAFPLQLLASHVGEYTITSLDIPILREGNVLILANATLEVAEACSGIRSLVSLFTLGIVFGYFVDRRGWVRAVIALSAIPVAILANGLRVASAGVAAHNFGTAGVEGLFHEFSGWVVFVIAFLMMFALQRLLQRFSAATPRTDPGGSGGGMTHVLARAAVLVLMLGATSFFLANARKVETLSPRAAFDDFPMSFGPWQAIVDPPMEEAILKVLGADDYLSRAYYQSESAAVGLFMGYYKSQRQGDTIHSPLNCLPGAGWQAISEGRLTIRDVAPGAGDITVNRYVIQKGLERQLVLYWYQSHGRVVASEYWSRAYLINDAIRLNRTDGALVRVIAPIRVDAEDGGASAERLAEQFVRTIFPALPAHLPN